MDLKSNARKVASRKSVTRKSNGAPKKIIDVAIDLFAANGFEGTSIRDIANAAGMTITGIYYYFGNKEGLLMAILEESTTHIVDKLREIAESDLEPLERFRTLLKTHLNLLVEVYRRESKILFIDEERLSRLSRPYQIEILNIYRSELEGLKSLGYVHFDNLTVLGFHIFGILNWHLRWYRPDGRMSLEEMNDDFLAFVLHGVLAPEQELQARNAQT